MIPTKISQTVLDRLAAPGEVLAVVVTTAGSGLGTFVLQGRSNRSFAFQFQKTRGAHVLRFPASFWTARKGEVARELFDHSVQPMVPTVEPWDASRSLSELVMPPAAVVEPEPAPVQPNSDPAPTGPGLAILIDPTPEQVEEARRQGREDFGLDSALGNPFAADIMPALHQAWQEGFDKAEAEDDREVALLVGSDAFLAGKTLADNPYHPETEAARRAAWIEGFEKAVAAAPQPDDHPTTVAPLPIIEPAAEGGFIATSPDAPGANGQGETEEEARESFAAAVDLIAGNDSPPPFRLDGRDIMLGDERVGGLFDPGDHLRMAKGKTELREQVEAFLATLP